MARSHAKVLCSIWQDPSWCALKPREQWAFTMLLSQPKLSLVGCLDYMPGRWVKYAAGLTEEQVVGMFDGLERAGYVCVDHDTFEILVRTFTVHDGIPIANERLRKGLWGAYAQVGSPLLRKVAVDNMPDEFFDFDVPPEAEHFRCSERMEWVLQRAFDDPSEGAHDSPVSCSLPPVPFLLPPTTSGRSNAQPDFDHPPMPKVNPADIEARRQELARVKDAHPYLVKGTGA